jgi:hypothetical protein
MYIQLSTQKYPVSQAEVKSLYTNTSFPEPFSPPDDYAWVFPTPKPQCDQILQSIIEATPEYTNKNVWEQRWQVVSKFVEYTDGAGVVHTVQEQEANAINVAQKASKQALKNQVVFRTQERLDAFARTRDYDDIKSASSYSGCSVPKFDLEGTYCRDKRAETWQKLYELLEGIETGTRPTPSSFDEIEPLLPPLAWPN